MVTDPQYIVDKNNRRTGVLLDIDTFEQMQNALESAALFERMKETEDDEVFDIEEARAVYDRLRRNEDAGKGD